MEEDRPYMLMTTVQIATFLIVAIIFCGLFAGNASPLVIIISSIFGGIVLLSDIAFTFYCLKKFY